MLSGIHRLGGKRQKKTVGGGWPDPFDSRLGDMHCRRQGKSQAGSSATTRSLIPTGGRTKGSEAVANRCIAAHEKVSTC